MLLLEVRESSAPLGNKDTLQSEQNPTIMLYPGARNHNSVLFWGSNTYQHPGLRSTGKREHL